MATAQEDTGWADDVDYGDDDDDNNNEEDDEPMKQDNGWADDVDYGDDDDDEDMNLDDDEDGIGDLDLSDDGSLPPDGPESGQQTFKSEITSELENPNKVRISFKLEFDPKDTPADISDDDETAPYLRINQFQLVPSDDIDNKEGDTLIGSGAFAKVFRARNTKTGKLVALKCMYKNLLRKQFLMKSRYDLNADEDAPPQMIRHTMLDAVQIELQIMMKIKHINIVRLYNIIDDPTKDSLYLAIEYSPFGTVMDFDGKLLQYIPSKRLQPKDKYIITDTNVAHPWWYDKYMVKTEEQKQNIKPREKVERFNEDTARKLFMDCIKGMEYLHGQNIIHRDLKPENLLLFNDDNHESGLMVKIADFGTAEQFNSKDEAVLIDTQGTYHFMSPTAIGGDKRNAFYDDIWALGIILYSFIYGTVPFFHSLDYQLFESIQNDELVLPPQDVLSASDEVRDLLMKLLVKKDEDRIALEDIGNESWYQGYVHPEYVMEEEEEEEVEDDNNKNDNGDIYEHQGSRSDCCIVV